MLKVESVRANKKMNRVTRRGARGRPHWASRSHATQPLGVGLFIGADLQSLRRSGTFPRLLIAISDVKHRICSAVWLKRSMVGPLRWLSCPALISFAAINSKSILQGL